MKPIGTFSLAITVALLASLSGFAAAAPITALAFTPTAERLVAVSQAGLQLYSWPELDHKRTIRLKTPNIHCLAFSPDAKLLAVGGGAPSDYGAIEVLSWPDGEPVVRFESHNDSVRSIVWESNTQLVSGSIDREIKLWQLEDQPIASTTLKGHSRGVNAICLIDRDRLLISTGADRSLRVWNLDSQTLIRSLNQHTKPVSALSLRPSEEGLPLVASAAQDRTIRFWQPTIGRMVRYIRLPSEPLNLTWTHDGARVLASCVDGHIRVIDPVGVTVTHDLPAVDSWAYAMALHPHDQTVAVGGIDGQIRRVDLPSPTD